jgi:hypothetical protein
MPDFPSRADGTVPQAGDGALDELLAANQPAQDVAEELEPVTAVLAALRAAPTGAELAGQARAVAEFRRTVRVSHRAGRGRARRPAPIRERLSSKLAVITAATAVAVSGTMVAAYVGALSGPIQQAVHDVLAPPENGAAHGRPAAAAFRARRLHPHSAAPRPLPTASVAVPPSPVTGPPVWRHGQAGSARRHDRHKRPGHHEDHRGPQADHHEGMLGDRHDGGPTARRDNPMARFQGGRHDGFAARRDGNPMAHHKGSRLQSPLPRAAVFPNPPAGPDRPGAGGR